MRPHVFAILACACAHRPPPPPPAAPVACTVTVRVANQTANLYKVWIEGLPAATVLPASATKDFSYRDAACSRTSLDFVARQVRATATPGWFELVPVETDPPTFLQYHQALSLRGRLATAQLSDASVAEPVAESETDLLFAKIATLDAGAARTAGEEQSYRAALDALSAALSDEHAARLRAEAARDQAQAALAQAQGELALVPESVRQDIANGTVTAASVEWSFGQTDVALRSAGSSICEDLIHDGGTALVSAASFVHPETPFLEKVGVLFLEYAGGRAADGLLADIASRVCD